MDTHDRVTLERRGHLLLIGLNRPAERNLFDMEMIGALAAAYGELERDPELRCGVVFAHGKHFSLGLDLARVAPVVAHSCQQKQGMMQELLTGRIRLNRDFKDERIT